MRHRRTLGLVVAGIALALVFGFAVSRFASKSPDGLEYVAERQGFSSTARDHPLASGPLADYGGGLTNNEALNTAIAAAAGVLLTLAIGYGVFLVAGRAGSRGAAGDAER